MDIQTYPVEGPVLIRPRVFGDDRGWFMESFKQSAFREATGLDVAFIQDNHSFSAARGTVRGLHYQSPPHAQAKLVRCLRGAIRDIIVDVRTGSPTYGQVVSADLSAENKAQLFVPEGFLHGFCTLSDDCEIAYKVSDVYAPDCDGSVAWNSKALGLDWGIDWAGEGVTPTLSGKDEEAPDFADWTSPF